MPINLDSIISKAARLMIDEHSACTIAVREFADHDVTARGAVSTGVATFRATLSNHVSAFSRVG